MAEIEDIELFLCDECCQSEYLRYFVTQNFNSHGECVLCKAKKDVIDICTSPDLKSFCRFLVRYYYSEAEYNSRWGGVEFSELFSKRNYLFNINRYSKLLNNDFFLEVFDVFIDNLIDPFDHNHPIDLYYGYDDNGRNLYDFAHIESKSTIWEKLKKELQERNYYLLEEDAVQILKKPLQKLENVIAQGVEIFRARVGFDHEEINNDIFNSTQRIKTPFKGVDISQPPVSFAEAGRANRQGISFLYLATNRETAISEVRPAPGNYVSIGKFRSNSELTLIDLRFIDLSKYYKDQHDFNMFKLFRDLESELSFPVLPSERNRYLITQFLADIIRKLKYDGLIFSSSINKGDNYVIFYPEKFDYIPDSASLVKITKMGFEFNDVDYHISGLAGTYKEI